MSRAWTIQPWVVWEQVEAGRAVTVDWRYAANLHACYDWLREQLVRRIHGYGGRYPWWAYGACPDLRRHRHDRPYGHAYARIELGLPPERVAVLPAWGWDRVFYGEYLSADPDEVEGWKRRMCRAVPDPEAWPLPEPWHTELLASWERIFDPVLLGPGDEREVVFEVLQRACVRAVTHFVGAARDGEPRRPTFGPDERDGPTAMHR